LFWQLHLNLGVGGAVLLCLLSLLRACAQQKLYTCEGAASAPPTMLLLPFINARPSHFFKMPRIAPAFPCSATCDPSTAGGVLLRHFTVTPPSADAPAESSVSFISTMLPLHDMTASIKTETVFTVSTAREVTSFGRCFAFFCPAQCFNVELQVLVAATAAHGGGCLHAFAFVDGEAQVLTASGDVAASSRVFERSAPTAVSICVPLGLIAWSGAGSCCITDLSLQVPNARDWRRV